MSDIVVYLLLAAALILPIVGAALLRLFSARLTPQVGITSASLIFALAVASVLTLARSDVSSLRIGQITLLLPISLPAPLRIPLPAQAQPAAPQLPSYPAPSGTSALPAATAALPSVTTRTPAPAASAQATRSATPAASATATLSPSASASPEPTAAPSATPEPTAAPPPPTEAPAARRTYVVQEGDSIRSIAAQFNVSVGDLLAANNLSPKEADTIKPGQELIIP